MWYENHSKYLEANRNISIWNRQLVCKNGEIICKSIIKKLLKKLRKKKEKIINKTQINK